METITFYHRTSVMSSPSGSIPNASTYLSLFCLMIGADCFVPILCAHSWHSVQRGTRLHSKCQRLGTLDRGIISCTQVARRTWQFTQNMVPLTANRSRTTEFSLACTRSAHMIRPFAGQVRIPIGHVLHTIQEYLRTHIGHQPNRQSPCREIL